MIRAHSPRPAAADGTHFETYEDNLLAEHHIRYGKTGGIAYRHIADNYIAIFSRFIACGTYEATCILDALLLNLSDLHPTRVHADTHGQSAAVFGLAYLLGIELMPYPPLEETTTLSRRTRLEIPIHRFDVQWHCQLGADP